MGEPQRLEEVVDFKGAIRLSQAFDDGEALFEAAKEQEVLRVLFGTTAVSARTVAALRRASR